MVCSGKLPTVSKMWHMKQKLTEICRYWYQNARFQIRFWIYITLWCRLKFRKYFSTINLMRPIDRPTIDRQPLSPSSELLVMKCLRTYKAFKHQLVHRIEITGRWFDSFYIPMRELMMRWLMGEMPASLKLPLDLNICSF